MACQQNLKIFRTPTRFHDACVAAPSRKAALEAWGSGHDLFARGVAEQVADEALMCEPQAHHGKAIKLLRSTVAERLAALPDGPPPPTAKHTSSPAPVDPAKPKRNLPKPKPRSNRELPDRARQALDKAKARYEAKRADMKPRADELAREPALEKREKIELAKLSRAHDKADAEYQAHARMAWLNA